MKIHIYTFGILVALMLVHGYESRFKLFEDKQLVKGCLKEVGLPEDTFDELEQTEFKLETFDDVIKFAKIIINPKLPCLIACFIKSEGGLVGGKLGAGEESPIENFLNSTITQQQMAVAKTCAEAANKEENECDVIKHYFNCIIEKMLALGRN